ncbi:MAG: STAS/SEC14 domain-containing protein [Planctomycetota bacterium]
MTHRVETRTRDDVVELDVEGKLTRADYQNFAPFLERRIQEHGAISLLVVLHDFAGWTAGAMWEDVKFDASHYSDVERLAIVGESKWQRGLTAFSKPFTGAEVKYFDAADEPAARVWVEGSPRTFGAAAPPIARRVENRTE